MSRGCCRGIATSLEKVVRGVDQRMGWFHGIYRLPSLQRHIGPVYLWLMKARFGGSERYWRDRYSRGRNSGEGSYGPLAQFKADVINAWWQRESMGDAIEFGCGDGHQLQMMRYPQYLGLDISSDALDWCRSHFVADPTKRFMHLDQYAGETACTALSLDVIYHLVEDQVFDAYMQRLFGAAREWLIIYSSDTEEQGDLQAPHVRHRQFSAWISRNQHDWHLVECVRNIYPDCGDPSLGSSADMHLYRRQSSKATHPEPASPSGHQ